MNRSLVVPEALLSSRSLSEAKQVSVSEQSVEAGVSLTSLAHEAGQSDDVFLASHLAFLVNLANTNTLKF